MPARGVTLTEVQLRTLQHAREIAGAQQVCERANIRTLTTFYKATSGGPVLPAIASALERAAAEIVAEHAPTPPRPAPPTKVRQAARRGRAA